jgi:hypothetical protein
MSASPWSWGNQTRHKWPHRVSSLVSYSSRLPCWPTLRRPPNPITATNFAWPCTPSASSTGTTTCTMQLCSRSFSRSWQVLTACGYSRTHRHWAQKPCILLLNGYSTYRLWWMGTPALHTPNWRTMCEFQQQLIQRRTQTTGRILQEISTFQVAWQMQKT